MGVDFADIDRDGNMDCFVVDMLSRDRRLRKTQVAAQTRLRIPVNDIESRPQYMKNALFHSRGDGTYEEIADYAGVAASDWSWQPLFLDVDLDGYEDLIITAGHSRDVQDADATAAIKSLQHPWPPGMDPKAHQEAFTREMKEHARLYPPLAMPLVTFRNVGGCQFVETTPIWGADSLGVHQGAALADFDGDGDLDLVVNNLNGSCGLYRNDGSAPRVAVRLRGLAPNTQGIGAIVRLFGGAVPVQMQEMVCGGRYLSGSEALLTFAPGQSRAGMVIEVQWRSGKRNRISDVQPNRLYEIYETRQ